MLQRAVRTVKNEKGLTLIELLAVVVILGIIAAIAIPAIGGLIDNSKKDAHVANAVQMINSAKLAVVGDDTKRPSTTDEKEKTKEITLEWLIEEGYLEPVRDPDGDLNSYKEKESKVIVTFVKDSTTQFEYSVKLVNEKRGVQADGSKGPVEEAKVARSEVRDS